jgi:hypothetical protein
MRDKTHELVTEQNDRRAGTRHHSSAKTWQAHQGQRRVHKHRHAYQRHEPVPARPDPADEG